MNHRTLQEVEKSHFHDLAHFQPPGSINGSVVVRHQLEAIDPEIATKKTLLITKLGPDHIQTC